MSEDAFHEIQLNGKQLVFVFMAVTVIAVVIFLCGVLVGRGVRAARGYADVEAAAEMPTATPPPVSPPSAAGSHAPAAPSQENLSYYERLDAEQPPPETVKEPAGEIPASPQATAPPVAEKAAAATEEPAAGNQPGGDGWSVQVAAVKDRPEADEIVKRLTAKGYTAYVMTPAASASLFRVRVGKFADRREAESVASRLQKEEQFKPWIVR